MASIASSCILLLILIVLPMLSHARVPKPKSEKPSSFDFLKHLQGCHKGDNKKGIQLLKQYLETYGYLNYSHTRGQNSSHANDDVFDDRLESSLKTYQQNFHLNCTGVLDAQTVSMLSVPRCGVPDIVNGTNWMRAKGNSHHGGHIHTVSHYRFFRNRPRWPRTDLTYGFLPNVPADAVGPVERAFSKWASVTPFTFSRAENYENADVKIGFYRGDHGDGSPFTGPGRALAHAFAPSRGLLHYDADEPWSVGPSPGRFDLETVAVHEIGHVLGLHHSEVEGAIMWPSISSGVTKGIHQDDIDGIRALYNVQP